MSQSQYNVHPRNPDQIAAVIESVYRAGLRLSLMIWGEPGSGKSSAPRDVAKRLARERQGTFGLIDCRLSEMTAADIGGLPGLDHDTKRTIFFLPDFLPTVERDGPEGILFLDELANASEEVRAAAYELILDRKVGTRYTVPDGWMVVAASNRMEDNAISADFGTALNDRLVHLQIKIDPVQWCDWGSRHGINPGVLAFIQTRPNFLKATDDQISENLVALPTPRSWERVSQVLNAIPESDQTRSVRTTLIQGIVGEEAATQFILLADELTRMSSIEAILDAPVDKLPSLLPKTNNGLWAIAYALVSVVQEGKDPAAKQRNHRILDVCHSLSLIKDKVAKNVQLAEIRSLAFTLVTKRLAECNYDPSSHAGFLAWNDECNEKSNRRAA